MPHDVDRQVSIVDHHQARGLEVVDAADQAQEVAELAHPAVGVRLQEEDAVDVRPMLVHRAMDEGQIAVEHRRAGRGEHHPAVLEREAREDSAERAEQRAGEQVLRPAHRSIRPACGR
jgi:hypothetical protein